MVLSAIARPIEPDAALPVPFPTAIARDNAPASAATVELSVASIWTLPCVDCTTLEPVILAATVCLTWLSTPTPAPARAPVNPLLLPPLAPETEPPTPIDRMDAKLFAWTSMSFLAVTREFSIALITECPPSVPLSFFTTVTPTATAAVAPPLAVWLLLSPNANATVPATPMTSSLSRELRTTDPFELLTKCCPELPRIVLVIWLSISFKAADPAAAIPIVSPLPPPVERATEADTPMAREET